MCVYVCVYIYIHTHTYTHIHTHTYTHTFYHSVKNKEARKKFISFLDSSVGKLESKMTHWGMEAWRTN